MGNSNLEKKSLGSLNRLDFERHPIWTLWEEDYDESFAIPVEDIQDADESLTAFFIKCSISLADGSEVMGVISVSLNDQKPYLVEFFIEDETFTFSGKLFCKTGTLPQLAEWFGKDIEDISPITYHTPHTFPNGTNISGIIDLSSW